MLKKEVQLISGGRGGGTVRHETGADAEGRGRPGGGGGGEEGVMRNPLVFASVLLDTIIFCVYTYMLCYGICLNCLHYDRLLDAVSVA